MNTGFSVYSSLSALAEGEAAMLRDEGSAKADACEAMADLLLESEERLGLRIDASVPGPWALAGMCRDLAAAAAKGEYALRRAADFYRGQAPAQAVDVFVDELYRAGAVRCRRVRAAS